MNSKYFIVAGFVSVVVIVIIQKDVRRLDYPQSGLGELVVSSTPKEELVEEVKLSPELDASSDIGESNDLEVSNVNRRRQAARNEIETLFKTLVSNPNNRIEETQHDFTIVEDMQNGQIYYFAADDHSAYPSVYIKDQGAHCVGVYGNACDNWYLQMKRYAKEQDLHHLKGSLSPRKMADNWSASLTEPLDVNTRLALLEILDEENAAAGPVSESSNEAWMHSTGADMNKLKLRDERILDRIESYLTEEQYQSYTEFLRTRRSEYGQYLRAIERAI